MLQFLQCATVALAALSSFALAAPAKEKFSLKSRDLSFDYDSEKVRGVNLGGWFVLEPWITPSLFEAAGDGIVDEWTFCATLGAAEAQSRLSQHWNSWITAGDFGAIAAAGLNHVRIPVGYWAVLKVDGDPYVQGQLDVLDQAIGWARGAGLKVLIDLHGAPGSQNGYDNSGHYGSINWQSGDNVNATVSAIRGLAERYAGQTDVVTIIELLNEPFGPSLDLGELKKFYYDGWGTVRDSNADTVVCIHDAFEGVSYWNGFMGPGAGTNNVMLDVHNYQVFSDEGVNESIDQHVSDACSFAGQLSAGDKWTIVGEWSAALTDCAKYLNGRYVGPRYGSCGDLSTGSVSSLDQGQKDDMARYIRAQLSAYEARTGWIFWTWHTEGAPGWDLQDLLSNGLFPSLDGNYGGC